VVREFGDRTSDHVAAMVGSFRHQFVEFVDVMREPWTALGNSPKSTPP